MVRFDTYHSTKLRGQRSLRKVKNAAKGYVGETVTDLVLGKIRDVAGKKLKELYGKTEKKVKGVLHQKIEQAGNYVGKKISQNVPDRSLANVLKRGAKSLKSSAHKGLEKGSDSIRQYTEQQIDTLGEQIAPKPKPYKLSKQELDRIKSVVMKREMDRGQQ